MNYNDAAPLALRNHNNEDQDNNHLHEFFTKALLGGEGRLERFQG